MPDLTVVVCTHNPHPGRLTRTLDGLRGQSLPAEHWELVVIDNGSPHPLTAGLVAWHPNARMIREDLLGLTPARLRGIAEASGPLVVFVDDDNVLAPGFLAEAARVAREHPEVAVFGGPSRPEFETEPPEWLAAAGGPLGLCDHGDKELIVRWESGEPRRYPPFSPIGAGMCVRKSIAEQWAAAVRTDPTRRALDRRGTSLASGGDNDIVLTALGAGHRVGYFPALALTHLMPAGRLTVEYHRRLLRASNRTWMVVLAMHGASPWPPIPGWTLPLRKLKAYVTCRPWAGVVPSLRWQAVCGRLEGLAEASRLPPGRPGA